MKNSTNHIQTSHAHFLLLLLAFAAELTWAQPTPNPPGQISYQGFLTDANGVALGLSAPKNYDINFRLYTAPTGGNAIWGEIQTVTVDRGYFSVLLGQGAALGTGELWTNNLVGLFSGLNASDRYIGTTVKGISVPDSEIQPRLRMLSSPYSFLAANANALIGSSGQQLITSVNGFIGINKSNASPVSVLDVNGTVTATAFTGDLNANNINGSPAFTGTPTFNNGLGIGGGSMRLNNNPIYLRGGNDVNHGLVYSGTMDGPALYGYSGGYLGTTAGFNQTVLTWNSSGNVGIGTTAPAYRLDVVGDMRANNVYVPGYLYSFWAGAYLRLDNSTFASGGNAYWNSDKRLKKEIATIPNALQSIKKLRGVNFYWNETGLQHLTRNVEQKWKSASGTAEDDAKLWEQKRGDEYKRLAKQQTGFIAQEVESAFPDWVTTDDKGYKQINMQHLDAILVNAVREQQDQLDAQQQLIDSLKSANQSLERRLDALEKSLDHLAASPNATSR